MHEDPKNTSEISRLPIFPLPLVLLPNEFLPLHIFEPRYRQMLTDITETDSLFGLVFFDPEHALTKVPEAGSYGCIAEVRDISPMPDGRSNILVLGKTRFELSDVIDGDLPYLSGDFSTFEDHSEDGEDIADLAGEAFDLFRRVAQAAHEVGGGAGSLPEIQQAEPETLSFLIASAFSLENELKLELARMRSASERLHRLLEILKEAVLKAEDTAKMTRVAKTNGHGGKGLDLSGVK